MRSSKSSPRRRQTLFLKSLHSHILLLLLLNATTLSLAQENPLSSLETQVAPGIEALKSGDLDTAQKVFSSALRHGAKHPLVYHNLGVIAQMRNRHLEAVQRFREALALQPAYGPSRLLLGASLLALGRNTEAVRELERAVKLMPEEPQARLQLAKAYEASENWLSAAEQLQKLVEMVPRDPEYAYQMGKAWMRLSGWSYQQIARIDPKSARLHQGLGQEYLAQEKYDLALEAFQRALDEDPKLLDVHLAMSAILLEQKKFDQALAEIAAELKLVPESKAAAELKARIEDAKASSAP
jgi:tetratricopeptide (TPR) repeat protein